MYNRLIAIMTVNSQGPEFTSNVASISSSHSIVTGTLRSSSFR